jgi:hypothetical protein
MKQTAVDFAVEQLEKLIPSGNQILIGIILGKAKEIERQQIVEAVSYCLDGAMTEEEAYKEGEQYFEETYK